MSGTELLIDSNILIYLSKRQLNLTSFSKPGDHLSISIITYMEVLGFPFKEQKEEELVKSICDSLDVIYIDQAIAKEVVHLRKVNKIKLPDAIIAATALVNNLKLVTRNSKDL
jgi:predicted nucleic acid-binding protein